MMNVKAKDVAIGTLKALALPAMVAWFVMTACIMVMAPIGMDVYDKTISTDRYLDGTPANYTSTQIAAKPIVDGIMWPWLVIAPAANMVLFLYVLFFTKFTIPKFSNPFRKQTEDEKAARKYKVDPIWISMSDLWNRCSESQRAALVISFDPTHAAEYDPKNKWDDLRFSQRYNLTRLGEGEPV